MRNKQDKYRRQLLGTVSAVALLSVLPGMKQAHAEDADRPTVWLELGWHFDKVDGIGDLFHAPFMDALTAAGFSSTLKPQQILSYGYGGEGKISFQPEGSDWIFSASVRYGRSHGRAGNHQQTTPAPGKFFESYPAYSFYLSGSRSPDAARFSDFSASNNETNAIADFQAGKDVGLGRFGNDGTSSFALGVRYAQLASKSGVSIKGDPDFHWRYPTRHFGGFYARNAVEHFSTYVAYARNERKFQGIGPSISWDASAALAGNPDDGEITFDWSANAAALFGRQRARGNSDVTDRYWDDQYFYGSRAKSVYDHPLNHNRSRSLVVPNVGGSVGMSFRFTNTKLSIGYRGDFFFGAIDGGIDTRNETTRGFYGPFASISVGVSPSDF